MLALLLNAGANTENRTVVGQTALFWASGRGQAACARILLERGAHVNAQDDNGDTPLHRCAWVTASRRAAVSRVPADRQGGLVHGWVDGWVSEQSVRQRAP